MPDINPASPASVKYGICRLKVQDEALIGLPLQFFLKSNSAYYYLLLPVQIPEK